MLIIVYFLLDVVQIGSISTLKKKKTCTIYSVSPSFVVIKVNTQVQFKYGLIMNYNTDYENDPVFKSLSSALGFKI